MFDIDNFPTNEIAKDMLSMVSPIYDKAYVGIWLYQIMGIAMLRAWNAIQDMSKEEFPDTATNLLYMWEDWYGIATNESLSLEERRRAVVSKRNQKRPMNPARIAAIIADITGRDCFVRENTAQYEYEVCISPGTSNAILDKVRDAIKEIQQPKRVVIVFETPTSVKIRAEPSKTRAYYAMTGESLKAGTHPEVNTIGRIKESEVDLRPEESAKNFPYTMTGTQPDINTVGKITNPDLTTGVTKAAYHTAYKMCGLNTL